jgi:cell division protein FtsW
MDALQARRRDELPGQFDLGLLVAAGALASLGVIMVASSSIAIADGQHVGPFYYLTRHVVFLALGIGLGIAVTRIELEWFERTRSCCAACDHPVALVFVPGLGLRINGTPWIRLASRLPVG